MPKHKIIHITAITGNKGFSLVELMIVIAIIAVISAFSIPAILNPENKARKAARELMGDMHYTRTAAIKDNQDYAIVFRVANGDYLICSDSGVDNVWSATADNTVVKTISFTDYGAGIQYGNGTAVNPVGAAFGNGVTYNVDVLTFNPQGTCSAGYVYLFYRDATYAIGTLSTGIIRVFRWVAGGWQ